MTDEPSEDRSIDITRQVQAPPETVWRALTDPEELRRWFPLEARVEPGEEGSVWLSWGPGVEGEAPIHVWEPGARFGWTEEMPGGEDGEPVRLAVDFHLAAAGGGTTVRLVHSGFGAGADWDDYFDAVRGGWTYFMFNLAWYLERHPGTERDMVWIRRPTERSRADVWDRLLGEGGLVEVADPAAPQEGDPWTLGLGDETVEPAGEVAYAHRPHHFAGTCPGLNDALLFVELEGSGGGRWHCGVWLSTYGLSGDRVRALQEGIERRWAELMEGS